MTCPITHVGRAFHDPIVRQMMRALGIGTCDTCHRVIRMYTKRGAIER